MITRLNVPYGNEGGWPAFHLAMLRAGRPVPVHPNQPNNFNPIHEADIIAALPAILAAASVPATIVNWGGDETVSVEEWCAYLAELTGTEAKFDITTNTIGGIPTDNTRRAGIAGATSVHWKDGMKQMVEALDRR